MNKIESIIFNTDIYKDIENKIKIFLNNQPDFLGKYTAESPRAIGDAIQKILSDNFQSILNDLAKEYNTNFSRKSMEDFSFVDKNNLYYKIDVKTHNLKTEFNMPNLTSVERLSKFYQNDENYFVILMVDYDIENITINVKNVKFIPIEFLDWGCLRLGALGWAQIQIANASNIIIKHNLRKEWMIQMCDKLSDFYLKEINKANKRIEYFRTIKNNWINKGEQIIEMLEYKPQNFIPMEE
jgi:hypothetical protein